MRQERQKARGHEPRDPAHGPQGKRYCLEQRPFVSGAGSSRRVTWASRQKFDVRRLPRLRRHRSVALVTAKTRAPTGPLKVSRELQIIAPPPALWETLVRVHNTLCRPRADAENRAAGLPACRRVVCTAWECVVGLPCIAESAHTALANGNSDTRSSGSPHAGSGLGPSPCYFAQDDPPDATVTTTPALGRQHARGLDTLFSSILRIRVASPWPRPNLERWMPLYCPGAPGCWPTVYLNFSLILVPAPPPACSDWRGVCRVQKRAPLLN